MTTIHQGLGVTGLGALGSGPTDKTPSTQDQGAQPQPPLEPGSIRYPGEVEITPAAQLLANLSDQIAGTPDINHGRVDAIRQALSTGSYAVDASRIADGLLAAQKFDAQAAAGTSAGPQSNTAKAFAATAQLGSERS